MSSLIITVLALYYGGRALGSVFRPGWLAKWHPNNADDERGWVYRHEVDFEPADAAFTWDGRDIID